MNKLTHNLQMSWDPKFYFQSEGKTGILSQKHGILLDSRKVEKVEKWKNEGNEQSDKRE